MRRFWAWLGMFAYRRLARAIGRPVPGVPMNRDPNAICPMYEPRRKLPGDWDECQTDGHSLCRFCCHRDTKEKNDEETSIPGAGVSAVFPHLGSGT